MSGGLSDLFTESAEEKFLTPDQAFGLEITQASGQVQAAFKVAPGYYLYKERIKFSLSPVLAHEIELPAGDIKNDPNFGKMEVYHHDFVANIVVKEAISEAITIKATYQR